MKTTNLKKTKKTWRTLYILLSVCLISVTGLSKANALYIARNGEQVAGTTSAGAGTVLRQCTLAVQTSSTPASCLTCPNGTATASISGGKAPFTYQWSNGDTTSSISNLLPGVYTCCVKDSLGCHDCSTVRVRYIFKCHLIVHTSSTPTSCLTCANGSATATVTGGIAPLTYHWSNGDTTSSISNLLAGIYTCCVKDANGCHDCSTVIVRDTLQCHLMVQTSSTPTSCLTCANGSATATVTGGVAPLTYHWSNGDTTSSISNLLAGIYTCCVKDANGCHDCSTVIVRDTLQCHLMVQTSSTPTSCLTCANGSATATVTGGVAPSTYHWSNGDTTSSISNLLAGIYTCCVKDANGCHDCSTVIVRDTLQCHLMVQTSSTPTSCLTCANGSATATVTGGTAPLTYHWSNGDTTSSISNLLPGVYTCCVKDSLGCHDCSTVIVRDTLECHLAIQLSSTPTSCRTCPDGSATATVTGGVAPLTYQWSNGDTTSSISNLLPGMYFCCVKDANGCRDCGRVIVRDTLECHLMVQTSSTPTSCRTCPDGSATATVTGGVAPLTYHWSNGDTTSSISNLLPGVYICCVKDSLGCRDCSAVIVRDTLRCNITVQTSSTQASCFICRNGTATATVSGGTAPFTYSWSNGDTTSSISNLQPGVYRCCVKDANGCRDCSIVFVTDSNFHPGIKGTSDQNDYDTPEGIQSLSINNQNVNLYPNPSTGVFRVVVNGMNNDQTSELEITNLVGQVIYQTTVPITNGTMLKDITLKNIPNGTYFVRIITKTKVYNTKIVINK